MQRPENATLEQMHRYCDVIEQGYAQMAQRAKLLEEQIRLARLRRFGASSERVHPDQVTMLFDEAEATADPQVKEPEFETIAAHRRRKRRGQRQETIEALTVDEVVDHELPEDERQCGQCGGHLHEMSTETTHKVEIIPPQVKVVQHVQHVYACRQCEREATSTPIVAAPMPAPPIPKSLASPSAIAFVLVSKYVMSTPLYRLVQQFQRDGIPFSRQTLANWVLIVAERWLASLYALLTEHLLRRSVLHADETVVQVLREPERRAEQKSYMWLFCSGRDGPPIVVYEYQMTRAAIHPEKFLSGFSGYLHVDGFKGYESVPEITLVGCWAHARRKFSEALKALPPKSNPRFVVMSKAGLAFCNKLFKIEESIEGLTPEQRKAERDARSAPVLEEFKAWLEDKKHDSLPKFGLGKAINYCLNQWTKLTAFLEDGRLEISNNRAERSVKPFVIGRKNWLFSNTPKGARASAITYSIMETAKANNLDPFRYLKFLLEMLPNMDTDDRDALEALLPWSETLPAECRSRRTDSPATGQKDRKVVSA